MATLTAIQWNIISLEIRQADKRTAYFQGIKNGMVFDDLKKIFLEVKRLQEQIDTLKQEIVAEALLFHIFNQIICPHGFQPAI